MCHHNAGILKWLMIDVFCDMRECSWQKSLHLRSWMGWGVKVVYYGQTEPLGYKVHAQDTRVLRHRLRKTMFGACHQSTTTLLYSSGENVSETRACRINWDCGARCKGTNFKSATYQDRVTSLSHLEPRQGWTEGWNKRKTNILMILLTFAWHFGHLNDAEGLFVYGGLKTNKCFFLLFRQSHSFSFDFPLSFWLCDRSLKSSVKEV